jgi:hypothetical protein
VILSILDISEKNQRGKIRKTIAVYLALSLIAIAVDNIYAIFGHGVRSAAMTWMFLYPLIGGTLFYLLIELLLPWINRFTGYRVFFNIYNSGTATLTTGSFLKGILDIAGTSSPYVAVYYIAGWVFIVSGLIVLTVLAVNYKRLNTSNYGNSDQTQ